MLFELIDGTTDPSQDVTKKNVACLPIFPILRGSKKRAHCETFTPSRKVSQKLNSIPAVEHDLSSPGKQVGPSKKRCRPCR